MRFGIFRFGTGEGIRPDAPARAVEERGFASLFVGEHSPVPAGHESPYPASGELPRMYDPFVALTAAASVTSTPSLSGVGGSLEATRHHGTDPAGRGRLLDAMKPRWTAGEATFHGEFTDFDRVVAWPKPGQPPHPPIPVGGDGRYAARHSGVRTGGPGTSSAAGLRRSPGGAHHAPARPVARSGNPQQARCLAEVVGKYR